MKFTYVQKNGDAFAHRVSVAHLNNVMEFDHVIYVDADGNVHDAPDGMFAPSLCDGELDTAGWDFFTAGYSGALGQAHSPIMHDSEYIGGRLERDILAQPGYYVAVANYVSCQGEHAEENECECTFLEGWAVAYRESE